jgi:ParB family chromosome partitioning protein
MHNHENTKENKNKDLKRGLGRGLGSLLSAHSPSIEKRVTANHQAVVTSSGEPVGASASLADEAKVWRIPIDKIIPGTFQPRSTFPKEPLEKLAESIKSHGIIQPILVRKLPNGAFELIAGERRWRAAQIAGLHEVPATVKLISNQDALEIGIIENLQREDLNPIEEAEAYQRLIIEFGLSQQQVADRVGKERATVANAIRLLSLPVKVRDMVSRGELSVGVAKVILGAADQKKMEKLAQSALQKNLTVKALEKLLRDDSESPGVLASSQKLRDSAMANLQISQIAEELQKAFGTKVQIESTQGRGKISISFYSTSELNQLIDKLRYACQKK